MQEEEEEKEEEEEWLGRSWWMPTSRMPLLFSLSSSFVKPQGQEYPKCCALNIKN